MGQSFVKFVCEGKEHTISIVENGNTVSAPYSLDDGFVWFIGDEVWNFNEPIVQDTVITAKKSVKIKVTVNNTMDNTQYDVYVDLGKSFDFSVLQKQRYSYKVISDEGIVISEMIALRDCVINVIYY